MTYPPGFDFPVDEGAGESSATETRTAQHCNGVGSGWLLTGALLHGHGFGVCRSWLRVFRMRGRQQKQRLRSEVRERDLLYVW